MKRLSLIGALAALIAVGLFLAMGRRASERPLAERASASDSVWYHESDVALLASTGRPQLVEFFHPD